MWSVCVCAVLLLAAFVRMKKWCDSTFSTREFSFFFFHFLHFLCQSFHIGFSRVTEYTVDKWMEPNEMREYITITNTLAHIKPSHAQAQAPQSQRGKPIQISVYLASSFILRIVRNLFVSFRIVVFFSLPLFLSLSATLWFRQSKQNKRTQNKESDSEKIGEVLFLELMCVSQYGHFILASNFD